MPLQDTIREAVRDEITGVTSLGKQAVESGAYLYPLKGIFYFVSHRNLWGPLTSRLAPLLGLSTAVIVSMFLFTYVLSSPSPGQTRKEEKSNTCGPAVTFPNRSC